MCKVYDESKEERWREERREQDRAGQNNTKKNGEINREVHHIISYNITQHQIRISQDTNVDHT